MDGNAFYVNVDFVTHNVAPLGIVTGHCLAESIMKNLNFHVARFVLFTSILAVISTVLAEISGGSSCTEITF